MNTLKPVFFDLYLWIVHLNCLISGNNCDFFLNSDDLTLTTPKSLIHRARVFKDHLLVHWSFHHSSFSSLLCISSHTKTALKRVIFISLEIF